MATAAQKLIQALGSSRYYPDVMALRWANRAERDIAAKSGCLKSVDSVALVASVRPVKFSGHRVPVVEYVPVSGATRTLQHMSPAQMGRTRTEGTTPKFFFQWGTSVHVEPTQPAAPVGSLNLYIDDYPEAEMSAATENPSVPADYNDLIVLYGQVMAALKDRQYGRAMTLYYQYRTEIGGRSIGELNAPDSRLMAEFHEKPETGRYK
jgi:hypothetical protein